MNQELIKKVQDGTHCIEHTMLDKDLPKLNTLLKIMYPNDAETTGEIQYYFGASNKKEWLCDKIIPCNITPIPLDDFFKEKVNHVPDTGNMMVDNGEWVRELLDAAINFRSYQTIRTAELLDKAIEVANVKINETKHHPPEYPIIGEGEE